MLVRWTWNVDNKWTYHFNIIDSLTLSHFISLKWLIFDINSSVCLVVYQSSDSSLNWIFFFTKISVFVVVVIAIFESIKSYFVQYAFTTKWRETFNSKEISFAVTLVVDSRDEGNQIKWVIMWKVKENWK